jgi:myo-inositol 2-dehydrogenase/D-chiro-inositol 1-dehydrogenase
VHLCDIRADRLAEVQALTGAATATTDYRDILNNPAIEVVYISTTPEPTHYPIARDCLKAGKHVLLEKPIALDLAEADDLINISRANHVKFTIGYSQRFNPKIAFAKKKITDGTLGNVVNVMVSRHLSRSLGKKIANRTRLSPAAMESTHDLDFVFWLLEPAKPVRVYSQGAYGYMKDLNGSYDCMWTTVTMDNGVVVVVGGGWNLPPSYPNYCATWIEITGTEGALILDDTARDHWLNTVSGGTQFAMSTMPGEHVDHVFAGQMGPETIHFLESVLMDRPVMVTPEHARMVMETYSAADISADRNEPVTLPLSNSALSDLAQIKAAQ